MKKDPYVYLRRIQLGKGYACLLGIIGGLTALFGGSLASAQQTLEVRPSSQFQNYTAGESYEADTWPDLATPKWFRRLGENTGAIDLISDGVLTMDMVNPNNVTATTALLYYRTFDNSVENFWKGDSETGYTVEIRIQVEESHDPLHGAMFLGIRNSSAEGPGDGWIDFYEDRIGWGSWGGQGGGRPYQILAEGQDNSDGFHVFRVVKMPGENEWHVWRDDVLIGTYLTSIIANPGQPVDELILGDFAGGRYAGKVHIDYLRWDTTGAYAPTSEAAEIPAWSPGLDLQLYSAKELKFDTEVNRLYLMQTSADGETWSNEGIFFPGTGETVSRLFHDRTGDLHVRLLEDEESSVREPVQLTGARDSTEFSNFLAGASYEGDELPTAASPRWGVWGPGGGAGPATVGDGALTLNMVNAANPTDVAPRMYYRTHNAPDGNFWAADSDIDLGYTVEVRLRVEEVVDPVHGAMMFTIRNGSVGGEAQFEFFADSVRWWTWDGAPIWVMGAGMDNTDGFHTFRIVKAPGENVWALWRDGLLIGAHMQSVPTSVDELIFGSTTPDRWAGRTHIDYVRWDTTGAYAPADTAPTIPWLPTVDVDHNVLPAVEIVTETLPNRDYRMEASGDLMTWDPITDWTPGTGENRSYLLSIDGINREFYRQAID